MQTFFDGLWPSGDPWELDQSPLDQARYSHRSLLLSDMVSDDYGIMSHCYEPERSQVPRGERQGADFEIALDPLAKAA